MAMGWLICKYIESKLVINYKPMSYEEYDEDLANYETNLEEEVGLDYLIWHNRQMWW